MALTVLHDADHNTGESPEKRKGKTMKTWKQWFEDNGEIKRLGDNLASVTDGQDRFVVQAAGLDEEMHNDSDDTDEAADEYAKWCQKWTAQQPEAKQWWKFGGDNLQARYGYGTHAEAVQYCEIINGGRDINQYYIQEADREDSDLCDEWNNISDDIQAIKEEVTAIIREQDSDDPSGIYEISGIDWQIQNGQAEIV